MEILGVPAWFFAAVAIVSLFLGVGIRQYLDRRKVHEERVHREEVQIAERPGRLRVRRLVQGGRAFVENLPGGEAVGAYTADFSRR